MNLEHLKLFVRLSATHNISQAGKELGISPAVASTYINKLETALETRLVHRTTRKVSLTEEGEAFLPHAEEVLASVEAARASVGSGDALPSGTLRITAPASFGRMHLIPGLKDFMKAYPSLNLDLRLSDSIIDMVEGGFDIAIRNAQLKDSSLIARKLAADKRIICASPEYLENNGTPQSPEELKQHACVQLSGLESWAFNTDDGVVTVKPMSQLRADNGEAVRDACVDGLGIAMCSQWCVYKEMQNGALVPILQQTPLASESALWAVYPSSRLLAPKVRAFIDYFTEYFGSPAYWDAQCEAKLAK
ncbi:transcriptional regulator, lysR family [Vibrio ishigakensis]|uniref:Transcriptional regulator, lysR family n=1 Tax=Vibrio ishigakensis TaxID=1481914 RepID=A0A0B8P1T7_9VIBR|nr:LysR family transcriptional regulator [Vibrio ishigakensis]GAM58537.1 transcriptional regulator, lysR family [Vibrio ishigakensis]